MHFSQDAALQSARALASYGVAGKDQREAIKEAIKGGRFTTAFGKTLKHLISSGVGLHHAGMLPRYRLLVEKLAQQGLLPVICGTDTLGVGINVPIHTVLLTGLTKFDGATKIAASAWASSTRPPVACYGSTSALENRRVLRSMITSWPSLRPWATPRR